MPNPTPTGRTPEAKQPEFADIYPAFFCWMKLPDGTYTPRLEQMPDQLSVPEAAKFLKLGVTTVKWLCDQGHLPCHRATPRQRSKRLITKADVVRYKAKMQTTRDAA